MCTCQMQVKEHTTIMCLQAARLYIEYSLYIEYPGLSKLSTRTHIVVRSPECTDLEHGTYTELSVLRSKLILIYLPPEPGARQRSSPGRRSAPTANGKLQPRQRTSRGISAPSGIIIASVQSKRASSLNVHGPPNTHFLRPTGPELTGA